ncbi:major facilitator superfamily protein [Mycolicibacterium vaccae ATCC 25954]|uniref:Major facilitator superfamily protein n=4 Tax=Mycolicibacterium vaccae TaxID=1810 RepID=K0UWQ6_MYCVA|nr:major facilitator superfamily protein [Mycolicibacterium vaccae ATCC 25954]
MGIGRFVYTPILPLMTAQAGLSPAGAAGLATANYAGYLAGALTGVAAPRLVRTTTTWRLALVTLVASLALMPLAHNVFAWLVIRAVAGFASAVLFVIAVDWMLDHARGRSAQLTGWSGAWWASAALASATAAIAWHMRGTGDAPAAATTGSAAPRRWFLVLLACYSLEGVGYIVAGTFLVAAIGATSPGRLSSAAWLLVGLAAAPSAALWARACARWTQPALLVIALLIQAAGMAAPALFGGAVAALLGAAAFGATFIGISTMALAVGRVLAVPGAVAVLTAGYSAGQIVGPLAVTPLVHHGFQAALLAAAVVVAVSAAAALWLRLGCRELSPPPRGADRRTAATPPVRSAPRSRRRP